MNNLNRKNIEKKNASQPYKLEADCPYSGGRTVVAYGSRDDLEVIKSVTQSNLKPAIVKNV